MSKQTTYEKLKAEIARTAKTPQEYEKRNVRNEMEAKEDGSQRCVLC